MAFFEPLRRGAEDFIDGLGEGWDRLRERSAAALTRFRKTRSEPDDDLDLPDLPGEDRWGLLASDVAETDDEVVVRIEAPGLEEKDFSVSVEAGYLVVRGEKRFEREDRGARYHLYESAHGVFERCLPLPCEVDADRAKALYRRGVLSVRLPRRENARRRRVRVRAA